MKPRRAFGVKSTKYKFEVKFHKCCIFNESFKDILSKSFHKGSQMINNNIFPPLTEYQITWGQWMEFIIHYDYSMSTDKVYVTIIPCKYYACLCFNQKLQRPISDKSVYCLNQQLCVPQISCLPHLHWRHVPSNVLLLC